LVDKSLEAAIKTAEMVLVESSGVRERGLDLVYKYLLLISPALSKGLFSNWNIVQESVHASLTTL